MVLLVLPVALAEADVETSHAFKRDVDGNLCVPCLDNSNNLCDGTETVSISIKNPFGVPIVSDQVMTLNGSMVCYVLQGDTQVTTLGIHEYSVNYQHPVNPSGNTVASYRVTPTGEVEGSGSIIFFSITFLIILGWMVYTIVNTAAHFMKLDFDMVDLMKSWIGYFVLLGLYGTSVMFFNSEMVVGFLDTFIKIGAWTHVILPLIALILSMTLGAWRKSRPKTSDEDFHYEY